MEIYSGTGKTKTDELRVTRAIGGLVIESTKPIENLGNERITIYIEKANSTNIYLANNVRLKHFILSSTFGESLIKSDSGAGTSALCDLATNGGITLGSGESLKISLAGLTSADTYTILGVEYPQSGDTLVTQERKTILTDELLRDFNVENDDVMCIDSEFITDIQFTYSNGQRIKYPKRILNALAFDVEGIISAGNSKLQTETGGVLMLPLTDVVSMDIEKTTGAIELTLLRYNLG